MFTTKFSVTEKRQSSEEEKDRRDTRMTGERKK